MAKASDTRPRLPKRRTTSSRKSSAFGRVMQGRFGKAYRKRHFERHGGEIVRDDRAQNGRVDALALRHIDHDLGARPAILRHGADDAGGTIDGRRHVLAIVADAR